MSDWVIINGQIVAATEAKIAVADRGFLLGDGLFETVRVAAGRAVAWDCHMARLRQGLMILGLPDVTAEAGRMVDQAMDVNGVTTGMVRLTVTRGVGPRGVLPPQNPQPTLVATAQAMAPVTTPMSVVTATVTRRNPASPLTRVKSLNYLDAILARQEAARHDADDAVLLALDDRVAETTVANLLLCHNGVWVTPPVADGALPGTARARLLDAGVVAECTVTAAKLPQVSAAFAVSALALRPVVLWDGRRLPVANSLPFAAVLGL